MLVVVGDGELHRVIVSVAGSVTWFPAGGLWLTTFPFWDGSQTVVGGPTETVRPWPCSTPVASLEL